MNIKYEDIVKANETITTTNIKGKDYAEVNQRIKAFRMLYPEGFIETNLISNENGVCVFQAIVGNGENILGTGTAYEKEGSTFINKTSYIENCETSAVGRALGMAGFGIDTSVASAEEVQNAINNQMPENPEDVTLDFGKYNGKTLGQIKNDEKYMKWLLYNTKNEALSNCVSKILGIPLRTPEEWEELLKYQEEMNKLIVELEEKHTGFDRSVIYGKYGDEEKWTKDTYKEIIETLKKKIEMN